MGITENMRHILDGIEEAKRGNTSLGLQLLERSKKISTLPEAKAWYGYCLARERNDIRLGLSLCHEARQCYPASSDICLALGRIYLLADLRESAVKVLNLGLRTDKNPEIARLLKSIGVRKPPVFPFIARNRRVNVASGRLLSRIGIR
ncbi:tetratricopeptide repeat protein [Geopsychrobacter electrodiphilus]|uniref:tetratricopeptide repeat protein n=1 Tax=Geopsychrobacter electrodiphilus TaxID=225196 RepID=UPI0003728C8E|nr:tetratricopeptide repeat protein [Geopsychrobacter electrodiphilus]